MMKKATVLMLILTICISPAMARKVKYPNGDIYKGKWKNGAPNGKGDMFYHDGRVYSGFWIDGKRSGQGKYIIPINAKDTIFYEGTWSQNRLQEGTLTTKKYTFNGIFKYYSDEIPKPYKGVLEYSYGDKFEGEFAEDRSLLNGRSHIFRASRFENGDYVRGEIEEMEYVNGERYNGNRCTDTSYYRYQCGDYKDGKFTGVGRDRFPRLGITKVFYSENEVYRMEFQDTCFLEGNIDLRVAKNAKGEVCNFTLKLLKGTMLIDTGGVYRKGSIDEWGRFTGVVRLPSDQEGFSGTIERNEYRKGRYNYASYYTNGYQEGEWKDGKIFDGVSVLKTYYEDEEGVYLQGVFRGHKKAMRLEVADEIWVSDFDGTIHGDTIQGSMVFIEDHPVFDTVSYLYEGTLVNGKRHGDGIFRKKSKYNEYVDCRSKWNNDTLIYFIGHTGFDMSIGWTVELTLTKQEYQVSHYYNGEFKYKESLQYVLPGYLFKNIDHSEFEYKKQSEVREAQERQKNIDAERKKNWEYVSTIKVATGYTGPTRGQVSYRYQMVKLYHKKGTSDNILVDYSGEVTNYAVGDKLSSFRKNATYGQPVNWNVLGSPQWGNAFPYYIWGVGYFKL